MLEALLLGLAAGEPAQADPPFAGAQQKVDHGPKETEADEDDDLVVTGRHQRGALDIPVVPEVQFPSRAIRALGVTSVEEVLEQIEPQTRGARPDSTPAVLVAGQRVSSSAEYRELPPEAISRIDVFPAAAAVSYGFAPGQRVINIVLKRRYRALTLTARPTLPLGNGRRSYNGRIDLVRLAAGALTTATIDLRRSEPVYEREASGVTDKTRTVRPLVDRATFNAAVVRPQSSVTMRLETEASVRGLGTSGENKRQARLEISARTNGARGEAQWTLNAAASLERTQRRLSEAISEDGAGLRVPIAALWDDCQRPCALAAIREVGVEGLVRAPLALLGTRATGSLLTTLQASNLVGFELSGKGISRGRSTAKMQASVQVPLVHNPDALETDAQLGISRTSDFGELVTWGAGVTWRLSEDVSFDLRYSREEVAPTLEQLGAPRVPLPSVRLYDFAQGLSTFATVTSGGSPDLRPQVDRTWTWRAHWIPIGLSIEYSNRRSTDPIVAISAPTIALQRLLPQRSLRAADGRLITLDIRPINVHAAEHDELRVGMNRGVRWGRTDVRFGVYHRWRLRDRITVIAGTPALNLLDGDAIEADGGTTRHLIEANGSVSRAGVSMYFAAKWSSDGRVTGGMETSTRYNRALRLDLKLLVNLREQTWLRRHIPGVGGTLNLSVDNVLNRQPSLESGRQDAALGTQLFAGSGRTIRITLRKRFQ